MSRIEEIEDLILASRELDERAGQIQGDRGILVDPATIDSSETTITAGTHGRWRCGRHSP